MRLFVAVDLPDELASSVVDAQRRFDDAPGLRLTDSTQAHVTLAFLGDVEEDRLAEVEGAVEAGVRDAAVGPFEATVGGFGVFPSLDYISVVWTGVRQGTGEMNRLHESIQAELLPLGFEPDDHAFTPHVTLARMDDARGKETVQRVVREEDPTIGSFRVEEVRLKRSDLTPDGPSYSTVERFPL
ncbi:RNA 2',3'-cyclic phosphodiesterase [Salinigranum rubrum]|uniref:RNA 2',3'-cyclic phosphodiesterase n=1 Tax=Salinigranum rubrum TaxID=755307 RepID=A0A2I8VNW3_9EURY|nr:RNA 2',3'-cyclic phosphodiesterase [Salinigranum rubrum]AUV83608.1 RNA 2',3'-cyclic phosphodiesterase [Salinigranum rubrum]